RADGKAERVHNRTQVLEPDNEPCRKLPGADWDREQRVRDNCSRNGPRLTRAKVDELIRCSWRYEKHAYRWIKSLRATVLSVHPSKCGSYGWFCRLCDRAGCMFCQVFHQLLGQVLAQGLKRCFGSGEREERCSNLGGRRLGFRCY